MSLLGGRSSRPALWLLSLCEGDGRPSVEPLSAPGERDARVFKESGFPLCVLAYEICLVHFRNKIVSPSKQQTGQAQQSKLVSLGDSEHLGDGVRWEVKRRNKEQGR